MWLKSLCARLKLPLLAGYLGAVGNRVDVFGRIREHWAEVTDEIVPLPAQVDVVLGSCLFIIDSLNTSRVNDAQGGEVTPAPEFTGFFVGRVRRAARFRRQKRIRNSFQQ